MRYMDQKLVTKLVDEAILENESLFLIELSFLAGNKIKVIAYPNPSEGIININFSRIVNNVQFIITDVLGKIIKIQTYSSIINKNLELPNTKGIYFLTIKTQNSQQIIKIVKK